jgi:hypothetical protein
MKAKHLTLLLPLLLQPAFAQTETKEDSEGFKESTVTDYLNSKYKWEELKEQEKERPKVVVENKTPFKPIDQKLEEIDAEVEARLRPTLDIDDPNEEIPLDERGLDTVELREFQVSELYSPLMRMSELKDLETLEPGSGGAYLSEQYFSELENKYLNRWHIPLIGKSQEQLAKERYEVEKYQSFLGEVSGTIDGLKSLDPSLSKELSKEFRDTQYQYNANNKRDDLRFSGPDAKF